jgi:hypothetical protein
MRKLSEDARKEARARQSDGCERASEVTMGGQGDVLLQRRA